MAEYLDILDQTARSLKSRGDRVSPDQVVNALLEAEKAGRQNRKPHPFESLYGCWQLYFITGTKKTRAKAGVIMGAGRYLPGLVGVLLNYSPVSGVESGDRQPFEAGRIENQIQVGLMTLTVSGPAKFLDKNDILAFDFTRLAVEAVGIKLYDNYIRGGKTSEENFDQRLVKDQAFFAYFLIRENLIAARGRGGGLALWVKV